MPAVNPAIKRAFKLPVFTAISVFALSACASLPESSTLMTGIDTQNLQKSAPTDAAGLRLDSDPVCVQFYDNAQTYIAEAKKPGAGTKFLTDLALDIGTSVVTRGLIPSGAGTAGRIVVAETVQAGARHGRVKLANELDPKTVAGKNVIAAAAEVGCPIDSTP